MVVVPPTASGGPGMLDLMGINAPPAAESISAMSNVQLSTGLSPAFRTLNRMCHGCCTNTLFTQFLVESVGQTKSTARSETGTPLLSTTNRTDPWLLAGVGSLWLDAKLRTTTKTVHMPF